MGKIFKNTRINIIDFVVKYCLAKICLADYGLMPQNFVLVRAIGIALRFYARLVLR